MPGTGSQRINTSQKYLNFSYYSFFALLITTPLIFSKYIEGSFDLAKKSSLIVLGGIFIILTIIFFLVKVYGKEEGPGLFLDRRIDPVICLFLLAALISTIFSIKPYVSFYGQYSRQIGFITYLYLFAVYFLSSQILREENKAELTLKVMEFTGIAAALYALLQYFHLDPFETPMNAGIRPVSTLGHSTFAGGFMAILLPLSLMRIFRDKKPYAGILLSIIFAAAIIITRSRASYAAALAGVAVILILYPFIYKASDLLKYQKYLKINLTVIFSLILILALFVLLLPSNPFVERFMKVIDLPKTARWLLWRDSLEAFKLHPFTGSGIAAFPSVFEYFASYELKAIEPRNYFDHAHNVFIHTLVTMGIIGAAAYLLMLLGGFVSSVKVFFNSAIDPKGRLFFLSMTAMLTGYFIYSLADFEDTSILLYLFVIFSLIKVMYSKYYNTALVVSYKAMNTLIYTGTIISIFIIIYCGYFFYMTYTNLEADSHYREAKELYARGDIKGSINELNNAVTINFACAEYKYTLANYVQDYCLQNTNMNTESKINLLQQAEQELERARPNFFSNLQYKALLTVIKLQLGQTEEAEKIKSEIFSKDSLIINFRSNLAKYYYIKQDSAKLMNELKAVFTADPYNTEATLLSASYYSSKGDKETALLVCDFLLRKYPDEPLVNRLKQEIISAPDIKKLPK
jgi:O-antigen ligase